MAFEIAGKSMDTLPVAMSQTGSVVITTGTLAVLPEVDAISIDFVHEKVHEGQVFTASYYEGTVANGGTFMISAVAGATPPHVVLGIGAGGNAVLTIKEAGTLTGTTALTAYNHYRAGTVTSATKWNYAGTIDGGNSIFTMRIPGGSGPQKAGAGIRSDDEWMLKSGTTSFEVVNISGGAASFSIYATYYEQAAG